MPASGAQMTGMYVLAVMTFMAAVHGAVWDTQKYGRGRLPRYDDVIMPLEWGQLQVLHTTDIHGWYQGHSKLSPPEPNYSGDWGDWIAFTQHMRRRANEQGIDLLLVDTGDLRTYTDLYHVYLRATRRRRKWSV